MQVVSLVVPLLFSGIMLIFVLKLRLLNQLNLPLDLGIIVSGRRLLGANKTLRGLLVHWSASVLCIFILAEIKRVFPRLVLNDVYSYSPLILGSLYALPYTFGELLNSLVKRRYGIAPGELSSRHAGFQKFFDLADGILVVALCLILFTPVSPAQGVTAAFVGILLHRLTDFFMRRAGLKNPTH